MSEVVVVLIVRREESSMVGFLKLKVLSVSSVVVVKIRTSWVVSSVNWASKLVMEAVVHVVFWVVGVIEVGKILLEMLVLVVMVSMAIVVVTSEVVVKAKRVVNDVASDMVVVDMLIPVMTRVWVVVIPVLRVLQMWLIMVKVAQIMVIFEELGD